LRGEEAEDPGGVDERELEYCCRLAGHALARRRVFVPLDPERHVRPALKAILGDPAFPGVVRYCATAVRRHYRGLGGAITARLAVDPDDLQDLTAWVRPVTAVNLLLAAAMPRSGPAVSVAYAACTLRRRFVDRDVRTARRREVLFRRRTTTGESQCEPAVGASSAGSAEQAELAEEFASALVSVAQAALAGASHPRRALPPILKCMALVLRKADEVLGPIADVTEDVIDRLRMLPGDAVQLRWLVTAEEQPMELAHLSRRPMWSIFLRLFHAALCERLGVSNRSRHEIGARDHD
jgi:hypothetical protein